MSCCKWFWVIFLMVILSVCAQAAESVTLSKQKVGLYESFELIFSSDDRISQAPDVSSIAADFKISGQRIQELSSLVNGQISRSYLVIYNLRPTKVGTFKMDALSWGGSRLPAVSVEVVQGETTAVPASELLALTATASVKNATLGAPFIYTIKLYDTSQILDGDIYPPMLSNAEIKQIGQDKTYPEIIHDKTVQVFERRYLITPKSAGKLTIPPIVFSGTSRAHMRTRRSASELFEMGILLDGAMNFGAPVGAQSAPQTLKVSGKPSAWSGWWLPADQVILSEEFVLPPALHVGEAVERKITLFAQGQEATALPELSMSLSSDFKTYPAQEMRETEERGGGIAGSVTRSIAVVPIRAGTLTVPAIQIPWFNTKTQRVELASLPSQTVTVLPAAGVVAAPVEDVASFEIELDKPVEAVVAPVAEIKQAVVPAPESQTIAVDNQIPAWVLIIYGVLIGMISAGLILFFIIKRRASGAKKPLPDLYPF